MEKTMLFNLQKFQILSLFANREADRNVTPAYAYAWDAGVYPYDSSSPWHTPYEELFEVRESMILALLKELDDLWMAGKKITFYALESRHGIHGLVHSTGEWDRAGLIHACRYFKLRGLFDDEFWAGLIGHAECPSEAHSINLPFTINDVYFE